MPASAVAPVGEVVLHVADCRTGQPVDAGYAYFSLPLLAAGVLPIDDGVVGPVGLGRAKYELTLSAPSYRPIERVLQGTGDLSTTTTLQYCMDRVAGSPIALTTNTYSIAVTCSPASGEVCSPAFSTLVSTADILEIQFTAALANCSAISIDVQVDGFDFFISDPISPGDGTSVVDIGPQIPGTHVLSVQATGEVGGCNTGTLDSWSGVLTVATVLPVGPSYKAQCSDGGWSRFAAFHDQGQCIAYVESAGTHL